MDLLKELALKGKLIFSVIHQPSSDIFKMFDKLFILDNGGYLIYDGNPVDSIIYFKSKVHHANWNDSECRLCGNVNPEQVFNIVDSKILDEYGNVTQNRKIKPQEWFRHFKEMQVLPQPNSRLTENLPTNLFKIPSILKQFSVFITRDVLSKISNRQYIIINLLEAPILAFLLSFIIRYYNSSGDGYSLNENANLPVYIFMAVIVAIFIGLSVSAEEIIKDRKIIKRERFLNLSRTSYLFSKMLILFVLSAFQAFLFVIIGNSIMGLHGMYFYYWLMLFSAWFFACLLGLNISDTFDTVVTIYILIPFLVIPQLILSGVIVSFDKLNPVISSPSKIPWYGEIITARWAYEALAVHQYKNNDYELLFYGYDKAMSNADYKKNYWVKTLMNKVAYCRRNFENPVRQLKVKEELRLLKNEFAKELAQNSKINFEYLDRLDYDQLDKEVLNKADSYLNQLNNYYLKRFNKANNLKDELINSYQTSAQGKEAFLALKRDNTNENLTSFVRNTNSLDRIIEADGQLYQKIDPIYLDPDHKLVQAHFYAPHKMVFGKPIETFWMNMIVIWCFNILLYFLLHFRILRKALIFFSDVNDSLFTRRNKKGY